MNNELMRLREFHSQIGESVSSAPRLLDHEPESDIELSQMLRHIVLLFNVRQENRTQLIRRSLMAIEELAEWIEAHAKADLVAAADAWGDRVYVLLGDAVATGLPAEAIFAEVHRSNMSKFGAYTTSGKGIKADSFHSPELQNILLNAGSNTETFPDNNPDLGNTR